MCYMESIKKHVPLKIILGVILFLVLSILLRELAWKGLFPALNVLDLRKSNIVFISNHDSLQGSEATQSRLMFEYWIKKLSIKYDYEKTYLVTINDSDKTDYVALSASSPYTLRLVDENEHLVYALGIPKLEGVPFTCRIHLLKS